MAFLFSVIIEYRKSGCLCLWKSIVGRGEKRYRCGGCKEFVLLVELPGEQAGGRTKHMSYVRGGEFIALGKLGVEGLGGP